MLSLKYILTRGIAILLIISLNACSKSSGTGTGGNGYPTPTPTPTPANTTIKIKVDSQFGSVIVNGNGKTMYFFAPDANGSSACTGPCLTAWPAVYIASPAIGSGLVAADFATITRSDGAKQTTYKGWPLYTYASDITAGDIKGDGISGLWYVSKPDYTVMLAASQLVGNDGISYDSNYHAATGKTIYMTDDRGNTLYSFSADQSGKNNYTLSDFSNDGFWPIVQINDIQAVPSSMDKSAFSHITVFTKPQLTYKGWPVYHFGPDGLNRGNTKGVSVPTPGVWPVMNANSPEAP